MTGAPFSSAGAHHVLGIQKAAANSSSDNALKWMESVRQALDEKGKANLLAAREALRNVPDAEKHDLIRPVISKLDLNEEQKKALSDLAHDLLAANYDSEGKFLNDLRENDSYREVLAEISAKAGLDTAISIDDAIEYAFYLEGMAKQKLLALSVSELRDLLNSPAKQEQFAQELLKSLIENHDHIVGRLLQYYGVTSLELIAVKDNIRTRVQPEIFDAASQSLLKAYFKVLDLDEEESGEGNNGGGGSIPSTGPGGSSAGANPFGDLQSKWDNATEAEKKQLVEEALRIAGVELQKVQKLDAASLIRIEENRATFVIGDQLYPLMEKAKLTFEQLAAFLEKAGQLDKLPKLPLIIDLGRVSQESIHIQIPAEAMRKWREIPFSSLDLVQNEMKVSFPNSDEFAKQLSFEITQTNAKNNPVLKFRKTLSPLFDFNLQLNGEVVSSFSNPITLSIPLAAADNIDLELVTLAKVQDGQLLYQGGWVQNGVIVEPRSHFSSYVVLENKLAFNDLIHVKAWAGRQIEVLAAKGAIEGRGSGVFDPKGIVTRAEFAKMLIHAFDLDGKEEGSSFGDIPPGAWYEEYVRSASAKGIINGRSAEAFAPQAAITRAEMATMVTRALKAKGMLTNLATTPLEGFKDAASINATLKEGAAIAASLNIVIGDNGYFRPNDSASRAEAAVMIYRALNV
ncbi:S-layer homology domain-containing protein [Paenibacillus pasadenensis]|uniref:S-layer homology domain-containing protein n=1 Tax=Paenibacillus pasadenensis TaxID=217090 RepID=UPI0003FD1815|nr:S-layer homology domain-containing protein [Paenibacillus pasadenensis]